MFKLYEIAKKVSGILVYVTYAILIGATLFITYSVVARFLGSPVLGSVEIVEVGMSAMVFASFAFTQTQKGHIHITMLIRILPERLGTLLFALCAVFSTLLSAAATYACFLQGQYAISIDYRTLMTAIPYAPFYFFAAACMCVLTLVLLLDTIIAFAAVVNRKYAEFVRQSW